MTEGPPSLEDVVNARFSRNDDTSRYNDTSQEHKDVDINRSSLLKSDTQKGDGGQSDHSSNNNFTPYQKIEDRIIARIDDRFDALHAEMSNIIQDQMKIVLDGLRESIKNGKGHKGVGLFRKILK
ncbi:hypothetical protein Hdeb2414_s0007g00262401 [Helianthus debilis subsp. tardiflorus]